MRLYKLILKPMCCLTIQNKGNPFVTQNKTKNNGMYEFQKFDSEPINYYT